jgi:hypothetical protein
VLIGCRLMTVAAELNPDEEEKEEEEVQSNSNKSA